MEIMADSFALYFQADFVGLNVMLFFAIKACFSVTVIGTCLWSWSRFCLKSALPEQNNDHGDAQKGDLKLLKIQP